jgi:hypothetical protein
MVLVMENLTLGRVEGTYVFLATCSMTETLLPGRI